MTYTPSTYAIYSTGSAKAGSGRRILYQLRALSLLLPVSVDRSILASTRLAREE